MVAALVVLPLAAVVVGRAAVLLAERGTGTRPVLEVAAVAAAVAAALAPPRYGLAVAVVLVTLGGFLTDFAGSRAAWADDAFAVVFVAKSLVWKRPNRREVGAVAAIAAVYGAYVVAGTDAESAFWAAKILFVPVAVGWAVARSSRTASAWRATFCGFAFACVVGVVLAQWQRAQGVERLRELGVPTGSRIKQTSDGVLRAFGGFTSPAPFAYALGLTLICWLALLVSRRGRRLALTTIWVPPAALVGMVWSVNRTAVAALAIAVSAVAIRCLWRWRPTVALTTCLVVAAAGVAAAGLSVRGAFGQSIRLDEPSVGGRVATWRDYVGEGAILGAGPGSAGAAYLKAHRSRVRSYVELCGGWEFTFTWSGRRRYLAEAGTCIDAGLPGRRRRALAFTAEAAGVAVSRRVTLRLGSGRRLGQWVVPPGPGVSLARALPAGRGELRLLIATAPGPEAGARSVAGRRIVVEYRRLAFDGVPAATKAEQLYERSFGFMPLAVVDNQVVAWIFDYGLLGLALGAAWVAALLWPLSRARREVALSLAAAGAGIFVLVAAVSVNVWEEAPIPFLTVVVLGEAWARARARRVRPGSAHIRRGRLT